MNYEILKTKQEAGKIEDIKQATQDELQKANNKIEELRKFKLNYECEICKQREENKNKQSDHIVTSHELISNIQTTQYTCKMRGQRTNFTSELKRNMMTHHNKSKAIK